MPRTITAHKIQGPDGRVYQAPNTYENQAQPAQPAESPTGYVGGKVN